MLNKKKEFEVNKIKLWFNSRKKLLNIVTFGKMFGISNFYAKVNGLVDGHGSVAKFTDKDIVLLKEAKERFVKDGGFISN
jgi:hypothetical protein